MDPIDDRAEEKKSPRVAMDAIDDRAEEKRSPRVVNRRY